jgi:hypothetical protein
MTAMMVEDGKRVTAGGARLQSHMIGIADIDLIARNSRGEENGVASKRSAAGAASHWLAVSANLSGKQARTKIPRKGMRRARLRVRCRDADLHLRNHRPLQTDPYLRG